MESAFIVLNI